MQMLITFASLFLSIAFVQLGSGGVAPLDAISGLDLGFATAEVGMLGSAHFLGFFVGCWWAPRLMGRVGHSRAFAAFCAAGTIGIAAHMMMVDPWAWAGLRMLTGLSTAGCYTIVEAWLMASVTNATRGRAMGVYRIVDIGASLASQLMIGVLTPSAYLSYNLLAILCCAALFPLALTRMTQPEIPAAPRLRPAMAWRLSPLAAVGVVVTGITGAAFRFVGPVYGAQVGLGLDQIALFLAAYVAGGWAAQLPMGWAADRFARRQVLIGLALATMLASGLMVLAAGLGGGVADGAAGSMVEGSMAEGMGGLRLIAIYAAAAAFGFATLPIYSVSASHANDFADNSQRVELAAALMFLYALGAIASPILASYLIEHLGPSAMFAMIALAQLLLLVTAILRQRARPAPRETTAYAWVPRTSFLIGRLLGRRDEG